MRDVPVVFVNCAFWRLLSYAYNLDCLNLDILHPKKNLDFNQNFSVFGGDNDSARSSQLFNMGKVASALELSRMAYRRVFTSFEVRYSDLQKNRAEMELPGS